MIKPRQVQAWLVAVAMLLALSRPVLAKDVFAGPTTLPTKSGKALRVLFVGNSYTFYNGGLSTLVGQLAAGARGGPRLECSEVTTGGQTLEGHWNEGRALAEIRKGGWDYVVLQEHSLRPLQDRDRMWQYGKMFDSEIRKVGAKTVFFETWARQNRPETQPNLNFAYERIARDSSAGLAPAGVAWERVLKSRPTLGLYTSDLSHPSPAGSYLNACVFYATLTGRSPEGLPRTLRRSNGKVAVEVAEADAALLQKVAADVCGRRKTE